MVSSGFRNPPTRGSSHDKNGVPLPAPRFVTYLVMAAAIAMCSGCRGSEGVAPENTLSPSDLRGRIEGWRFADSMAISATATIIGPGTPAVLAKGAVRGDGTFALSLPEPPPATLQTVNSTYDTLSDAGARILLLNGLLVANADESVQYWVMNQQKGAEENSTACDVDYFYADRPVTWRRTLASGGTDTTVVIFDLRLVQGWNRVFVRTENLRAHYTTATFRVEESNVSTWYISSELQAAK